MIKLSKIQHAAAMAIVVGLFGCDRSTSVPEWGDPEQRIETQEEREAVAAHEEKLLLASPGHALTNSSRAGLVAGSEDWHEVVRRVHIVAVETCCRWRRYEYLRDRDGWRRETGRWEYTKEAGR